MALNLITNPLTTPTTDTQWTNFVAREDVAGLGNGVLFSSVTLTNRSTTGAPSIAVGSIVNVGGSWYQADSDTAIGDDTAGVADGTVHIKLVPDTATPDPSVVVPYLTNDDIPGWDSEKVGWYDSADMFLPYEMTRSGATTKVYSNKCEYAIMQDKVIKFCNDGGMDIDASLAVGGALSVAGGGASIAGAVSMSGALSGATSISASGTATVGAVVSSGAVTIGGITKLKSSPTKTLHSLASGAAYIIPRGIYSYAGSLELEVLISGTTWAGSGTCRAGTIVSDGTNMRLYNDLGTTVASYLYQF